jgi:GLTT repeat (6 copies)
VEPERPEVLVGREDDEPLLRRAGARFVAAGLVAAGLVAAGLVAAGLVAAGLVAAGLVAEGVVAGAGVSAGAAVGDVAGAGVAASGVVELGVAAGVSGAGAVVGSGAGVVVAVPLPVPLLLPLLLPLLDVVEPEVAEPSAAAMLALPRLVRATRKTALTTTRPNPRRERCPPEPSDRWRPKLRTATRHGPNHKFPSFPTADRSTVCPSLTRPAVRWQNSGERF